jgi:hypothetical protein
MGESNGTNLKPTPTILFNKRVKIRDVLVLCQYSWHERLQSTSILPGLKVLNIHEDELQTVVYHWKKHTNCFQTRIKLNM